MSTGDILSDVSGTEAAEHMLSSYTTTGYALDISGSPHYRLEPLTIASGQSEDIQRARQRWSERIIEMEMTATREVVPWNRHVRYENTNVTASVTDRTERDLVVGELFRSGRKLGVNLSSIRLLPVVD